MNKSNETKRKKTTKLETLWINDVRFYLTEWRMPKPFFLIIFCYNKNTLTLIGIHSFLQKCGWIFPFYRIYLAGTSIFVWESINGISFGVHRNRYRMFFSSVLYTIGTRFFFCSFTFYRCTIQNVPSIFPGETIFWQVNSVLFYFAFYLLGWCCYC